MPLLTQQRETDALWPQRPDIRRADGHAEATGERVEAGGNAALDGQEEAYFVIQSGEV